MQPNPIAAAAAEQIERWLVERLGTRSSIPDCSTGAPALTASELLEIVRNVLVRRPALGQAARRLSTYDQLNVTLELARAFVRADDRRHLVLESIHITAGHCPAMCRAAHFRRHRRGR